jgi:hypothetical protein
MIVASAATETGAGAFFSARRRERPIHQGGLPAVSYHLRSGSAGIKGLREYIKLTEGFMISFIE